MSRPYRAGNQERVLGASVKAFDAFMLVPRRRETGGDTGESDPNTGLVASERWRPRH